MLYNKNWDAEDKVLSLESLIAWLEQQRPRGRYDYCNTYGSCLYGRYMASHGIAWANSGANGVRDSTEERDAFCRLVYEKVAIGKPWTYGAALLRARKALEGQNDS